MSEGSQNLNDENDQLAGILGFRLSSFHRHLSLETLASIATIVGTIVSILALSQSQLWLVAASAVFVCIAIVGLISARRARNVLGAASMVIEGQSIDSLNIANLRRRISSSFVVQEAKHTARIEGSDMELTWLYTGYCKEEGVSSMDFSIDSEGRTPFEELKCIAFDLGHDPERNHPIRPILLGADGLSKKISIPFLEPLRSDEPFGISLSCTLPRCLTPGFGYYTSTLSFAQKRIPFQTVELVFAGQPPRWVRVYESSFSGRTNLLKTLKPSTSESGLTVYVDRTTQRAGQSAVIYTFWRDEDRS